MIVIWLLSVGYSRQVGNSVRYASTRPSTLEARNAVDTLERRDKFARALIVVITLATFGPYIAGGIRTEQVVIYGIAALTLPALGAFRPQGGMRFLLPWALYVLVAILTVIFPSQMVAPRDPGNLLAGFDNIIPPLLIMMIIWTLVPEKSASGVFNLFCKMLATLLALNGILAVIGTRFDITALMRPFWATSTTATTTADLAAEMGRYSGIFNQPAEAGVMYSLAGIAAVYVWKSRPGLLALVLVPIMIGGLISVSKVFVIGGLPVIIIYWFIAQRGSRRLATVLALLLLTLGVVQSGFLDQWTGFNYLARLINPQGDGGALAFYTAGRLAENSTYTTVISQALNYSPVVGVGAGGWAVPYDGALTETLIVGGIIGAILYGLVVVAIFTLGRRGADNQIRLFAVLFGIIVTGACFGLSPLTANRISTVIWLMIALLVLIRRAEKLNPADDDQR